MVTSNRCNSGHFAVKRVGILLSILLITGCRLVIEAPDGGSIVSTSGLRDCPEASCAYPIEEETTDTYTAVPDDGYRFLSWSGVCARTLTEVCTVTLGPVPEDLAEYDGDIGLTAVFESTGGKRRWYRDHDGDLFGIPDESRLAFHRPEGYSLYKTDCDDDNVKINPFALEREDGRDNNCNGKVDEGFVDVRFHRDRDGDGYGDPAVSLLDKRRPDGYVRNKRDCNDADAGDNPDAVEVMDGRDNNCDGRVDEGSTRLFRDVDGDGFGVTDDSLESMEPVAGYVEEPGDCDDGNSSIFPGAVERFDSVDNDCDGVVDEGFTAREYYRDADGDGIGDSENVVVDVSRPPGYVSTGGDNCPLAYNPSQADIDEDGLGDACDPVDDREPEPGPEPGDCSLSAEDQAMLDTVNAFRAQTRICGGYGAFPPVPALSWSCELEDAARGHSMDMANNDFFSHTGTGGTSAGDRATAAGYSWSAWGENIAAGLGYSSVAAVVQGWADSPGHCRNMMQSTFTELGAAKHSNPASTYNLYWTQAFGRPR